MAREPSNYYDVCSSSARTTSDAARFPVAGGQACPAGATEGEAVKPAGQRRTHYYGWSAELAYDIDDIVVHRLVVGDPVESATHWERREAVRRMRARGMTQPQIADSLGVDERQVSRDLERFGLTNAGLGARRREEAARRRQLVSVLIAHGARPVEVATLLDYDPRMIVRDCARLGIRSRRSRLAGRCRAELLATFGYLLEGRAMRSA